MAMKAPVYFLSIFLSLTLLVTLPSCQNSSPWKEEHAGLLQRAAELEHRHCLLKTIIDSLWDVTTARLERALPAGFPEQDRKTFLKARNADHIRMFQSFKQLDAGTQSLVDQAGQYDALLAAQVRNLLAEKQAFERQKIEFLQKVGQKDAAAGRAYTQEFLSAATASCQ